MKLISLAIPLREGDEVLTSDQEHPAATLTWEYRKKQDGIKLRSLPILDSMNDETLAETFSSAVSSQTKVICLPHISSKTGRTFPVKIIASLARQRGILCISDSR